ncbi:MAG: indolepyruvate oxidoreductase subunit beta family protein [Beijerinckiaceae bacterium]
MMDESLHLPLAPAGAATERPISIAILAMGGQGGGVLTDWIVLLAEAQGWVAQATSVPGVAQRTGATLYYVETMPPQDGLKPILSLMPTPGDVDVVMAAEFMEAGRSILRGLVTPDKTVLIASNHRSFAVAEKMAPGDGIADKSAVATAIGVAAKKEIVFDMDALALREGSVISAAMFGALASSGALPFPVEAFRAIVEKSGGGAKASLAAFNAACLRAQNPVAETKPQSPAAEEPAVAIPSPLLRRVVNEVPAPAQDMARAGLAKVVDFQDAAYGSEYLDLLANAAAADRGAGGEAHGFAFTVAAARHLANAMAYDDVIRVADRKTRSARRMRIEREVGLKDAQVLQTTEFFHPRAEELVGMLPAGLARSIHARPGLFGWIDRRVNKGRRIRTYSLSGFLSLYAISGLRGWRRRSLRHATEVAHRDAWLACATAALASNYMLGVEILNCRRLVKGYSDTHARGLSKFDRVMAAIGRIEKREDAADWARRLRETALKDERGEALDGAIRTIGTFA